MNRRMMNRECRMMKWGRVSLALLLGALVMCGCNQKAVAEDGPGLWKSDYAAALKQAAAENKYVLVDFSGSDWCSWCIRLDREVFSKEEFLDYAAENLICVLVDFPRRKQISEEQKAANQALSERYSIEGFPTVLIVNPQGKVIERTGYLPGGPAAYVEMIKGVIAANPAK